MTAVVALVRWAHLLALMGLFGAGSFAWLLDRRGLAKSQASRLWLIAAAVAAMSAAAQLALTTANMSGTLDLSSLQVVLARTLFGQVFAVRAVALGILLALTVSKRPTLALVTLSAGVALAAVAPTSHAAASGLEAYASLRAAIDAIHLLTGGFWIGGLVVLLALARREQPLYGPVVAFADVAIYAVTALALAGMINAGFIFAAQRTGWPYFLLLMAKILLALAMILIAFLNRLRVMPALAEGQKAQTLLRNVRSELWLAAGVVALAAILGSISPG